MSQTSLSRRNIVAAVALTPIAAAVLATPVQAQGQPNMQAALDALRQARAFLEQATANKGGHRNKAIQLIDQAIAEVMLGIAAGAS